MDERVFWRTMNPARLHALFDSYFHVRKAEATPARSLSEYLQGG